MMAAQSDLDDLSSIGLSCVWWCCGDPVTGIDLGDAVAAQSARNLGL